MAEVRFTLDGRESVIDLDKLLFSEARQIERVTGKTFKQVMTELRDGSMEAMQAMVWTAFRRTQPGVKFSDYDETPISDVSIDFSDVDEEEQPEEDDSPDPQEAGDSPADPNL